MYKFIRRDYMNIKRTFTLLILLIILFSQSVFGTVNNIPLNADTYTIDTLDKGFTKLARMDDTGYVLVHQGDEIYINILDNDFKIIKSKALNYNNYHLVGYEYAIECHYLILSKINTEDNALNDLPTYKLITLNSNFKEISKNSYLNSNHTIIQGNKGYVNSFVNNNYISFSDLNKISTNDKVSFNIYNYSQPLSRAHYNKYASTSNYVTKCSDYKKNNVSDFSMCLDKESNTYYAYIDNGNNSREVILIHPNLEKETTSFVNTKNGTFGYIHHTLTKRLIKCAGAKDNPNTGIQLGGMSVSHSNCVVSGLSIPQDDLFDTHTTSNVFITNTSITSQSANATNFTWLTNYTDKDNVQITRPVITQIDKEEHVIMWEETIDNKTTFVYGKLDHNGLLVGELQRTSDYRVSIYPPLFIKNSLIWAAVPTNSKNISIYTLPIK